MPWWGKSQLQAPRNSWLLREFSHNCKGLYFSRFYFLSHVAIEDKWDSTHTKIPQQTKKQTTKSNKTKSKYPSSNSAMCCLLMYSDCFKVSLPNKSISKPQFFHHSKKGLNAFFHVHIAHVPPMCCWMVIPLWPFAPLGDLWPPKEALTYLWMWSQSDGASLSLRSLLTSNKYS